ncbi:MAG TPA: thiol peroxidase [Woeseiaceae bacterium]|nr:thiol peroxidase [Woeseiaceae bacterium]
MARIIYNGTAYRTYGNLPTVGSPAPDLSLVNCEFQDVSLAQWLGKRKVLNIFPSVDTPVCGRSILVFDRLSADRDDVAMLMVSCDLPFAHRRFREQHSLQRAVGLSAIRHEGFGQNYGVQVVEGPLEGMFSRAVVVLDENNTIVHGEQIEDVAGEPDYAAACRALGIELDPAELAKMRQEYA